MQQEYAIQQGSTYQPYPEQTFLMRSFFFNEHTENKEPIPQPEDYQPEPFYASEIGGLIKGYQPDSAQAGGWSMMLGLPRREEYRQAMISTAPSLQEGPGIKLEAEQALKEEDA